MADFYKYHGLGNDYLIIDPQKLNFPLPMNANNITLLCNRNLGIGSDGVLYGPIIKNGEIHFQIFNPDGSEAEKSGNGIRIFAQYIWDMNYVDTKQIILETKGGRVVVDRLDKEKNLIKVNMGRFSFLSDDIPVLGKTREVINEKIHIEDRDFYINCLTIGNPHCVIICKDISPEFTKKYGALIETHDIFPNRTNVQFVKILDKNNIAIQIWERGAGYTLASGSSSVAAACVSHQQGLVERSVFVNMPGGTAQINIDGDYAFLTATVARVMFGEFIDDFKKQLLRT